MWESHVPPIYSFHRRSRKACLAPGAVQVAAPPPPRAWWRGSEGTHRPLQGNRDPAMGGGWRSCEEACPEEGIGGIGGGQVQGGNRASGAPLPRPATGMHDGKVGGHSPPWAGRGVDGAAVALCFPRMGLQRHLCGDQPWKRGIVRGAAFWEPGLGRLRTFVPKGECPLPPLCSSSLPRLVQGLVSP